MRRQAERAGRVTNEQMRTLMKHYESALGSCTYLTESDCSPSQSAGPREQRAGERCGE